MTVQDYVNDILCVPVTRVGNRYITEAIELVLDTKDHKFYPRLAELLGVSTTYLEKAMRDAKNLGLEYMDKNERSVIFTKEDPKVSEYVNIAAAYYRRKYEV